MLYISILLIFLVSYTIFKSIIVVNDNEEAVVERNRRFKKLLLPGIHFLIPFFDRLRGIEHPLKHGLILNEGKIDKDEQILEFPLDGRAFYSLDHVEFHIHMRVCCKIVDSYKAVYGVEYLYDALNQLLCGIVQKRILDVQKDTPLSAALKEIEIALPSVAGKYSANWGVEFVSISLYQYTDEKGIRHFC